MRRWCSNICISLPVHPWHNFLVSHLNMGKHMIIKDWSNIRPWTTDWILWPSVFWKEKVIYILFYMKYISTYNRIQPKNWFTTTIYNSLTTTAILIYIKGILLRKNAYLCKKTMVDTYTWYICISSIYTLFYFNPTHNKWWYLVISI